MPEYLDDPSSLTKDKLKSELLAHNVELPSGNPTKDVYVQLYLKNLTAQNKPPQVAAATLEAFSSDEELPPPVVSSRSRSSGRKATRKTDKARPDELDVTLLSDEGLRDELLKHGLDLGPVVASTRKLYEKKLQKLLDEGPAQPPMPQLVATEIQVNHNGNSESDLYSDKEDEVTPEPEPVAEPEPAPVVERPLRSRGKTPVTTRTRSSQHHTKISPEDLRLVLTDQVQSECDRKVQRRSKGAAPAELPSASSRPVQEPAARRSVTRLKPAARSKPEEQPESTKVNLVTFSPMCDISPIKKLESHRPVWDQCGSPVGGSGSAAAEDVLLLQGRRQQKISNFLSTCSPVKEPLVQQVEKIAASEQTPRAEENEVLKELFTNDIGSPTGISATCRRPIRGAAGRPVKSSDLWNDENCYFSPKTTRTSSNCVSYTESRSVNRVSSLPLSSSSTHPPSVSSYSASSRLLSAVPPAVPAKVTGHSMSLWKKLLLLAIVAAFLFLVYQAMETNSINPFQGSDTAVATDSAA